MSLPHFSPSLRRKPAASDLQLGLFHPLNLAGAAGDGAPAPVLKANALVRAFPVGPGKHRVIFTFHSRLLRWGLFISAPSWLALILFWGWSIRRGKT